MNSNEGRTLWVSLGSGIFAALLLYSYSQDKKKEYDGIYGKMVNVVVARVDISEMRTIDGTMLEVVQRPADFVEPGVMNDPEIAVGQVAAVPIKKGEQILNTKLLQPGPDTGISLQVAPTKRAVSLPVDEVRGVAKLIRPGDRIDIFAAVDSGRGLQQRREVSLIMQDVVVLATGLSIRNTIPRVFELDSSGKNITQISLTGDSRYNTITVEANPKEAQDLIFLMTTNPGNIFLTLRNPSDRQAPPRMPTSHSDSILGRPSISADSLNPGPSGDPTPSFPPAAAPTPAPTPAPSRTNNQPRQERSGFRPM
ncbi:MAG: Flp pilus assembly protein CpaB [Bdellovibrio sp.]